MEPLRTHSRRAVLGAGIAVTGGSLLAAAAPGAAAGAATAPDGRTGDGRGRYVDPRGPEVAEAERRRGSGPVRRVHLEARRARIDLGGRVVDTWTYGDRLPGDVLRVTAGDTLSVTLANNLPQSTTLHWHGLPIRNDMDGVPDLTQRPIKPGASFHYRFRITDPGTYWTHPHLGVQQDHGLYAPLIVDDPREPMEYDHEWVVVLDDWLDGIDGSDPDAVLRELNHGRGAMHGHGSGHEGGGHGDGDHGGSGHDSRQGNGHGRGHGHHKHGSGQDGHERERDHGGRADRPGRAGDDGTAPYAGAAVPDAGREAPVGLDGLATSLGGLAAGSVGAALGDAGLVGAEQAAGREFGGALLADRASRGARRAGGPGAADGGGPSRILRGAHSRLLRGMPGNIDYPYHLINGRTSHDPDVFRARPGDRIRIRFINAGGDTAYRVALGGHDMTVTHTDGNPVRHARTDALLIGMAERYDVLVTAKSGVFPLVALAEGKGRSALAVLRTGGGRAPDGSARTRRLDGKLLMAHDLRAHESVRAARRAPDRTIGARLTGTMERFDWAINGRPYTPSQRYPVRAGERVRLVFRNHTRMFHPMHLHGHSFTLPDGGPRKDTTIVRPGQHLEVEFDADNPGLWMMHCHNIYHSESGMMTVLGYRRS
ncbi:copper oxidase [Streptomyces sp. NRRL F-4489]|uniref:multicopper oxidase family protein n=1 Tax=Streptomyces sp. NRRL F-4489 TaxID=1609095 RepID=UPI0007497618|nr:multicopper oxidase family protein [Streptomyces sp. NRRL F-4489]KUL38750.1 copper oxidase [Streptomyces sp. NRRL F-4489]